MIVIVVATYNMLDVSILTFDKQFQPSGWWTFWLTKKSGRRGVEANFGESLPNSTGTCKYTWSDTASHFLSSTASRPTQQKKTLETISDSGCKILFPCAALFSRLGLFGLSPFPIWNPTIAWKMVKMYRK